MLHTVNIHGLSGYVLHGAQVCHYIFSQRMIMQMRWNGHGGVGRSTSTNKHRSRIM